MNLKSLFLFFFPILLISFNAFCGNSKTCPAFIRFINATENIDGDLFFSIDSEKSQLFTEDQSYGFIGHYLKIPSGISIINAFDKNGNLVDSTTLNAHSSELYSVFVIDDRKNNTSKLTYISDNVYLPPDSSFRANIYALSDELFEFYIDKYLDSDYHQAFKVGLSNSKQTYSFDGLEFGKYRFRSKIFDFDGRVKRSIADASLLLDVRKTNILDLFLLNKEKYIEDGAGYMKDNIVFFVSSTCSLSKDSNGCFDIDYY